MMTPGDLRDELSRFTYRPGWAMVIEQDEWEGPALWVIATVTNSYNADKPVTLSIRSLIPPMEHALQFGRWLSWRLQQIESHESREWLHYNGRALFDPHVDHVAPTVTT